MPGIKVELNEAFLDGSQNNSQFIDFPYLSQEQLRALTSFIHNVELGEPLPGKNTPSWEDDDGNKIPYTESYKDHNYWHYHCGPTYSNGKNFSLMFNLARNILGATSAEVIHYTKQDNESIMIEAFSPQHVPFPASDHPAYLNPLFDEAE